ncbi:MAG: diaminopimelate decarboxylase [Candidatus Bathyarchaeia archaeon]|nr:diaminopimelate decarboxylase [Candidatus Bathyarchaeota archaeon]
MLRFPLENVAGELYVDGVSSLRLAEEFDTPLYVMSEEKIRMQYRRLKDALSNHIGRARVLYSAKANSNLSILRILHEEGAWLDVVSPGEVYLALRAGYRPDSILYTGTSVRDDELEYLLKEGVMINIDSTSQLRRLLRLGIPKLLSVRVNPMIGAGHHEHVVTAGEASKFGVWEGEAMEAYKEAKEGGVEKFGIHMHIGSGIMSVEPYIRASERLLKVAKEVHEGLGVEFEFIDLGGGLGIPYRPDEDELDLEKFTKRLMSFISQGIKIHHLGEPEIWMEPGRFLVAEAGVLLTKVNTLKSTPSKRYAEVDAGFNTIMRPTLYGSYHHIIAAGKLDEPPMEEYDIVGPICESGDILARSRHLPKLAEGDLLAILCAGAYGYSMSSQYNSRPRPAEVLVRKGEYKLIRRRERLEDLLRGQVTQPESTPSR